MGCWNGTCNLSGLPITSGDKIKLIFIIAHDTNPKPGTNNPIGSTYPDSTWSALPLVVSGCYNDYGSIDNLKKDECVEAAFQIFKDMKASGTLHVETDEYESKDNFENMKQFADFVERGRVTIKHHYRPERVLLAFSMIREDIWNTVIEKYKAESWEPTLKSPTADQFLFNIQCLSPAQYAINRIYAHATPSLFDTLSIKNGKKVYHSKLAEKLEKAVAKSKRVAKCLDEQNKFWTIYRAMHPLRRAFAPPTGSGSQDTDYKLHMALAKAVMDICEKEITRYNEDDEE